MKALTSHSHTNCHWNTCRHVHFTRVSHTDPKDQGQCAPNRHPPLDDAKSNAYTKFSAYFQRAWLLLMNHSDQGPSAIPHYHLCSNTTSVQMENVEGFSDVANLRRFEEIKRFTLNRCKELIRRTFRYLSFKIYWSFSQLQIQNLSTSFSKSYFSSCLLSSSQGRNPNSSHFLTWSNSAASNLCPQIWLLSPHIIAKNSLETLEIDPVACWLRPSAFPTFIYQG